MSSSRESSATSAPRIMCMSSAIRTRIMPLPAPGDLDQQPEPAVGGVAGRNRSSQHPSPLREAGQPAARTYRARRAVVHDLKDDHTVLTTAADRADPGGAVSKGIGHALADSPCEQALKGRGQGGKG